MRAITCTDALTLSHVDLHIINHRVHFDLFTSYRHAYLIEKKERSFACTVIFPRDGVSTRGAQLSKRSETSSSGGSNPRLICPRLLYDRNFKFRQKKANNI